jgi:hypothetical protein
MLRITRGGAIGVALCTSLARDIHTGARVMVRDSRDMVVRDASVRLVPENGGIAGEGVSQVSESISAGRVPFRGAPVLA